MQIDRIKSGQLDRALSGSAAADAAQPDSNFGELLDGLVGGVDEASANAARAVGALATGEDIDIHDVAIASEMESLAFSLALQVRNKVVEAYQEVMRMTI